MFKEIESENKVRLCDAADEGAIEVLPRLKFPDGKRGQLVFDLRSNNITLPVVSLVDGCQLQENEGKTPVLGLDCEWEPTLGGATPNPVSTVQLSLPDGTACCFHLQRGEKKTDASGFPMALKHLFLENPTIVKVRVPFVAD